MSDNRFNIIDEDDDQDILRYDTVTSLKDVSAQYIWHMRHYGNAKYRFSQRRFRRVYSLPLKIMSCTSFELAHKFAMSSTDVRGSLFNQARTISALKRTLKRTVPIAELASAYKQLDEYIALLDAMDNDEREALSVRKAMNQSNYYRLDGHDYDDHFPLLLDTTWDL